MSKKLIDEGFLDCDCQQNIEENFNRMAKQASGGGVQSDLSVNDESDPAFVKGRTHYYGRKTTWQESNTYSCTDSYLNGYDPNLSFDGNMINASQKKYLKVLFDGVEYGDYDDVYNIGNMYLVDSSNPDTGEPFAIKMGYYGFGNMVVREAGDHEITLGTIADGYITLPAEYLPEVAITKENIVQEITENISFFDHNSTTIANNAMLDRTSLIVACGRSCTGIGKGSFYNCINLIHVFFPKVTEIGEQAFRYCYNLMNPYLPSVTKIGKEAFWYCSIESIDDSNFPSLTMIGDKAFEYCYELKKVEHSLITTIGEYAFNACPKLEEVDLKSTVSIGNYAFKTAKKLKTLILRSNTVCELLGTKNNTFYSTLYLYVPSALVESYKTATNWSDFPTGYIRALEEYTVDGTTTGKLDYSKI